ncbi:MAG: AAA family ATPase, partial [Pseudomonadota bacterium]
MLQRLTIQNFAIIDQLSLEFSAGFGVISGETGAGKSILIDAIGQLLGDRAEATMVADGSLRADITAEFTVAADHPAHQWLIDQALDGSEDDPLMIRRVLSAEGGSRSWINGRPVSAGQLRSLGAHLVQIHGQHAHHQLLRADAQRRWLDQQLDDQAKALLLDTVHAHQSLQHELSELLEHAGNRSEQELLEFQLDELKRLDPSPNDYAQLEQDQRRLAAVDTLTLAMEQALQALDLDHSGARSTTHRARAALESVLEYEPALADVMNMIAEATVNLDEAASAIQRLTESLEADPEQLGRVDERLRR